MGLVSLYVHVLMIQKTQCKSVEMRGTKDLGFEV